MFDQYAINEDKAMVSLYKSFHHVFKLNQARLCADANYAIKYSRQEKLRMPEQQAEEQEIQQFSQYIEETIKQLTCDFTFIYRKDFVLLRDSLCSRLTLFNARRGGEPSRLKIAHYLSAKEEWVDNDNVSNLSECDKNFFSEMIIWYQPRKIILNLFSFQRIVFADWTLCVTKILEKKFKSLKQMTSCSRTHHFHMMTLVGGLVSIRCV
ncbi:hypothetical protein DPMN_009592 [Dreissena polymorpha]|uniref:Uncharacterized protein n=1 Tax=Dreissena polymorpha TaxID=45954 RepID=A0A9D4N2G9_DREPO|nr:hypothetical protein DPMN_009592 [Dreissena polymorpha]